MILGPLLILVILIVAFSLTAVGSYVQHPSESIKIAEPATQFKFDVPYAYIGKGPENVSYIDSNGLLMSPESQYPSAMYLNITQMPKMEADASDARIEVYSIQFVSDKGPSEKFAYFIGGSYSPSFSQAKLESLTEHIYDLIDLKTVSSVKGDFKFNWTDNTSILSHSVVGSAGAYSSSPSKLGLWSAGEPNAISVTIQRIGYVISNECSISVYRDAAAKAITDMTIPVNSEKAFIHNTAIPADALSKQADLFHPAIE